MTLTVKERLLLLNVLPREGDITTLRIVQNLRAALSFSEEEHARWAIVHSGGRVDWDTGPPQEAEVEIGAKANVLVGETLSQLSKDKRLTEDYLTLWDKFGLEA